MQPDEHWQSIEVAYKAVYGGETDVWLPWEWLPQYRLRNAIYPMYLSIPLHIVKILGIDTNFVVRNLPYLAHLPFVLINDWYYWRICTKLLSHNAARLAFALFFFNCF